jgi:hypothetical protein
MKLTVSHFESRAGLKIDGRGVVEWISPSQMRGGAQFTADDNACPKLSTSPVSLEPTIFT